MPKYELTDREITVVNRLISWVTHSMVQKTQKTLMTASLIMATGLATEYYTQVPFGMTLGAILDMMKFFMILKIILILRLVSNTVQKVLVVVKFAMVNS